MATAEDPLNLGEARYNPHLTYEERKLLRKLEKEQKLKKLQTPPPPEPESLKKINLHLSDLDSSPSDSNLHPLIGQYFLPSRSHPPDSSSYGDTPTLSSGGVAASNENHFPSPSINHHNSTNHADQSHAPKAKSSRSNQISSSRAASKTKPAKSRTQSDSMLLEHSQPAQKTGLTGGNASRVITSRSMSPQSPTPHQLADARENVSRHIASSRSKWQQRERSNSPMTTPTSGSLTTPPSGGAKKGSAFSFGSEDLVSSSSSFDSAKLPSLVNDSHHHPDSYNGLAVVNVNSKSPSAYSSSGGSHRVDSRGGSSDQDPLLTTHPEFPTYPANLDSTSASKITTYPSAANTFTFDGLEQVYPSPSPGPSPLSPVHKSGTPSPRSYAANLRFVDTGSPASPSHMIPEEPTSIRGRMQKTNVVYGDSHEEENVALITRIPSSGFFDPSQTQSQADFDSPAFGLKSSGVGLVEETESTPTGGKSSRERDSRKTRRSPLRILKRSVGDKIPEEDEGIEGEGREAEPHVQLKKTDTPKKKKEAKKAKRRSESMHVTSDGRMGDTQLSPEHRTVGSPIRKVSSASTVSPTHSAPANPKKKVTQSFRVERSSTSPEAESRPVNRDSVFDFATPSPSSGRSREATPGSDGGGNGGTQPRKRKPSLAKRIMSFVSGGGNKDESKPATPSLENPVVLMNYKMIEDEPPSFDTPTPQKKDLTSSEKQELHAKGDAVNPLPPQPPHEEDTAATFEDSLPTVASTVSICSSTTSTDGLFSGGSRPSGPGDSSSSDLQMTSSSEITLADVESHGTSKSSKGKVKKSSIQSSLTRKKKPSSTEKSDKKSGKSSNPFRRGTVQSSSWTRFSPTSSPLVARKTSVAANASPKNSPLGGRRAVSGSNISSKAAPSKVETKKTSTSKTGKEEAKRLTTSSRTSKDESKKTSKNEGKKTSTSRITASALSPPSSSPKNSPISARKTSAGSGRMSKTSTTTSSDSSSAKSSPLLATKRGVGATRAPTSRISPRSSPNSSPVTQRKTSDLATSKSAAAAKASPRSSPKTSPLLASKKISSSTSRAVSSVTSTQPAKQSTSKGTVLLGSSLTPAKPSGSPSAATKRTIKVTSSATPKSSPLPDKKPTSPAKKSVTASPPQKASPQSSFRKTTASQLAKGSKEPGSPATKPKGGAASPQKVTSPQSSTRRPAGPRLTKMSLESSKPPDTAANKSPSFQRFSKSRQPLKLRSPDHNSPVAPKRSTSTQSSLSQVGMTSSSNQDDPSSPVTPTSSRHRKIGVSLGTSPMPSPSVVSRSFSLEHPAPATSERNMDMSVDSLLASVEEKLGKIATDPQLKEEAELPAELFSPPSSQSSVGHEDHDVRPTSPPPPDLLVSPPSPATKSKPKAEPQKSKKTSSSSKNPPSHVTAVKEKKPLGSSKDKKSPVLTRKGSIKSQHSLEASGSESSLKNFTATRPPKPPSSRKLSEPASLVKKPGAAASSMGTSRPRLVLEKSTSVDKLGISKGNSSTATTSGTVPSKNLKPEATPGAFLSSSLPEKAMKSKRSPSIDEGKPPTRNSTLNKSIRAKSSSRIRPSSGTGSSRRYSVAPVVSPASSSTSTLQRPSPGQSPSRKSSLNASRRFSKAPSVSSSALQQPKPQGGLTTQTLNRKSMRRASSTDLNRKSRARSGSIETPQDKPPLARTGMYATMRRASAIRRPSTAVRESSDLGSTLHRKSMRKMSKGAPPPAIITTEPPVSPARRASTLKRMNSGGTLRRTSGAGEIVDAFDHVSAQASILQSSDHRRAVRPKARQKASAGHLKMLRQRQDVSSEITPQESGKVDLNTYSTYMGKKNLAPSAMAGLAANVDFSVVKLRKTPSSAQMLSDQPASEGSASPGVAAGTELNTTHSVMLIMIKGRRHVSTRLVQPSPDAMNSGDVFIAVTKDKLFHWVGKSVNVLEKARGKDVVTRISKHKELGCSCTTPVSLEEDNRESSESSIKGKKFWELLGGKKPIKSSESAPADEVYEKDVNLATVAYRLEGDRNTAHFVPFHDGSTDMLSIKVLHSKQIYLFDFYSEVYVWIGKQSPTSLRKIAVELGRKIFDGECKHPVFNIRASPARSSPARGTPARASYRRSSIAKNPRNNVLNMSGRRGSKVVLKTEVKARPDWALFARVNENFEQILFREKFADWPEPGRIAKCKGHEYMAEISKLTPESFAELGPADVTKMHQPQEAFIGLRLEGSDVYRGLGNYKISKSSFSCNRVHSLGSKTWVIKEFDHIEIPQENSGIFYSQESYVIRWAYKITVVRELEGLPKPGQGMFARDRKYQQDLKRARTGQPEEQPKKKAERKPAAPNEVDSEDSESEEDSEEKIMEVGGRDRCAYFFWQGDNSSVNEKGASALMTVELDKEKGPQVRVTQGKEQPTFLSLFSGGMMIMKGRSDTDSLASKKHPVRIFYVRGQVKREACLVEVTPGDPKQSLSSQLRSRGCAVVMDVKRNRLFLWCGAKATPALLKSGRAAARSLKRRLSAQHLFKVNEGEEPNDFCSLLVKKDDYLRVTTDARLLQFTPRLFELSSTTGVFLANEVLCPSRHGDVEAFTFDQSDLYTAKQPGMFLLDAHTEVYIWLGWWPKQENALLREANATTGSSHSTWLRDKKLALETALAYVKACNRIRTPHTYVVSAGTEHERFKNIFPFWEDNKSVQEIVCKGAPVAKRLDAETELLKYSRTTFKLKDLKERPPPEGVDPAKLEVYLSDADFKTVFKMDKSEFSKLPKWKQTKLKKDNELF